MDIQTLQYEYKVGKGGQRDYKEGLPEPGIRVSYRFPCPWYLEIDYRRKHALSLKDVRDMLLVTPIPVLLQCAVGMGLNLNSIMSAEVLTDHSLTSLQQWLAQMHEADKSNYWRFSDTLFKDDTRLQTALVNSIHKYFEFENKGKSENRCVCPYDTHLPPIPIHHGDAYASLIHNAKPGDVKVVLENDANQWCCKGPFHGYQKWQNPDFPSELILIQTDKGHGFLQEYELTSKKRKELYLSAWSDKIYQ